MSQPEFASWVVCVWLSGLFLVALRRLYRGDRRNAQIWYVVYFAYYAIPLILDLVYGPPSERYFFRKFGGFYASSRDPITSWIYLAYLAICPSILLLTAGRSGYRMPTSKEDPAPPGPLGLGARTALWCAMLLPFAYLPFSPDFDLTFTYSALTDPANARADQFKVFHGYLSSFIALALLAQCAYLATARKAKASTVVLLLCMAAFLAFLNGKRNSVAIWATGMLMAAYLRGWLRGRRLLVVTMIVAIGLFAFSVAYQEARYELRGEQFESLRAYDSNRLDFGRDNQLRLAIYSTINADRISILDYPGQSVLFSAIAWLPRAVLGDKPYPYDVYLTPAALGRPGEIDLVSWGITSSLLDELIANFGWLGMIMGPGVFGLLCRVADRQRSRLVSLMTTGTIVLLMSLPIGSFLPVFYTWAALVSLNKVKAAARP